MSEFANTSTSISTVPAKVDQPAGAKAPDGGSALRVLVAEDNVLSQKVIERIMRSLGCEVDLVATGADAVAAVERCSYRLVMMDIRMPVMDGVEATRLIRQRLPEDRQPLIYALTAGVSPEERQGCMDVGMNGFLTKPVERTEIAALVDSLR